MRRAEDLEANVRAESDTQIVMSAAGKIDFIADVETQADRAHVTFQTTAGIKNAGEIIRTKALDGTDSCANGGGAIVEEEVVEAALYGEEGMEAVMAKLEFRTEKAMEDACVGALNSNNCSAT